jgi:hypothetical protein
MWPSSGLSPAADGGGALVGGALVGGAVESHNLLAGGARVAGISPGGGAAAPTCPLFEPRPLAGILNFY